MARDREETCREDVKIYRLRRAIAISMMGLIPVGALAGEGPIVPDRPGFSTGTYTVEPGRLNVELGYQYAYNNDGQDRSTQTFPLLTLRTGLSSKAELDLLWDGWNVDDAEGQASDVSVSDVSIGGKYRIREGLAHNLTVLGLLSVPVGSTPSTSDHVDPLLGLLWDRTLSDQTSLFGVVQASSFEFEGDRAFDAQLAIGASFSHSDRVGTFIEVYGIVPSKSALEDTVVLDGGITYLLNSDVQLDINAGVGLNESADTFIGFGLASRL
jgi:hypothetical protein